MADLDAEDERVEELTTLQAIYPELVLDNTQAPAPAARLELTVAPVKPLAITFEHSQTIERLSYLPPLIIDIILAEGYPSTRPPCIKLATEPSWLPENVLRELEKEADKLWNEYGGMQMLFAYISYLQDATETAFGMDDEALILPLSMKTALLDLDTKLKKDIFEKETFDCGVCLEPKKGSACYRLQRCSHVFCKACLQDFYGNCIAEGDVNSVKCLSPDCGKTGNVSVDRRKKDRLLSPKELLQIPLPLETVTRFAQVKRKKKIEADPTIVFCPRQWCQGAMRTTRYPKIKDVSQMDESDDETEEPPQAHPSTEEDERRKGMPNTDRLVVCEDCALAFCKVCLASWHGDFIRCINREVHELTEEEQASLNFILKNTSPCPTCTVPCQKSHGCNHMTCSQCQTHFCYICGAWLDAGNPYQHFNDKRNKQCYYRLMDGAMGDDEHIQFGGARGAEQVADFWENEILRLQMEEVEGPS